MLWFDALFLGDSLTHGSRDSNGLSWPYYLAHLFLAKNQYTLVPRIRAYPGITTSQYIREAIEHIEYGADKEAKEVFLLLGTNDAKDEIALHPDVYEANMRMIVSWCKVQHLRPYVLTIPKPNGFGSVGYTSGIVDRIVGYNERLVDMSDVATIVDCYDVKDTVDGIHWTPKSAVEVANRVYQAIMANRLWT